MSNSSERLGETADCRDALQQMYEFLDNELPDAEREHVKSHLDDCIPCLEAFEFETELKAVIASRCKDDVPTELYAKVKMCLKTEMQKKPEGGIPTA